MGSMVCAVAGMSLHFLQTRLRSDKRFGQLHHFGLVGVALLSLVVFKLDFSTMFAVPALAPALFSLVLVPTFIGPEESMMDDDNVRLGGTIPVEEI